MDVTLNKYSSLLPWYIVLGLWFIPAILLVIWAWKVDKSQSWFKRQFLEHPVSYSLMFLILVPFGYQATSRMISTLPNNLIPLVGQSPAPTYQQECQNCAQAQGPHSTATYNQYGAPQLVMTKETFAAVTKAMKPYAGKKVTVRGDQATADSINYGSNLVRALQNAGLKIVDGDGDPADPSQPFEIDGTIMTGFPAVGGVQIFAGKNCAAGANALAAAIGTKNVIHEDRQGPDQFSVLVRPNR